MHNPIAKSYFAAHHSHFILFPNQDKLYYSEYFNNNLKGSAWGFCHVHLYDGPFLNIQSYVWKWCTHASYFLRLRDFQRIFRMCVIGVSYIHNAHRILTMSCKEIRFYFRCHYIPNSYTSHNSYTICVRNTFNN